MKKIGIVAAMTKELSPLLAVLGKTQTAGRLGSRDILSAEFGGKQIYIVESGVGEILAAGATQHLISAFGVDAVVNFGVCGSLSTKHGLEKAVIVSDVVHYEIDTSAIDGIPAGRYEFLPDMRIPLDRSLLALAKQAVPSLEEVVCASGNKFVDDNDEKAALAARFGAEVCEMEAAGVALTCLVSGVPLVMIKAVSDAEGGASDFMSAVNAAALSVRDVTLKLLSVL